MHVLPVVSAKLLHKRTSLREAWFYMSKYACLPVAAVAASTSFGGFLRNIPASESHLL